MMSPRTGRPKSENPKSIDIRKLNEMGLKIDDYSNNKEMKEAIRTYNNLVLSYIWKMNLPTFFHSRNFV